MSNMQTAAAQTTEKKVGDLVLSVDTKPSKPQVGENVVRLRIRDAKGNPVNGLAVGNGAIVKVGYELSPFYTQLVGAGVSLRLKAVQIITLVERGGADASYYGFETEEDGFEADETQINSKKVSASAPVQTPAEAAGFDSEDDDDSADESGADDDF